MALIVHNDHTEILEADEQVGVLRRLRTLTRVTGLTANSYQVLYDALSEAGVPVPGEALDDDRGTNLVLVGRQTRLVERDKGAVDVILDYAHVLDGPHQDLRRGDQRGYIYGRMRSALSQTQTNHYESLTERDPFFDIPLQVPIVTRHTFSPTDLQRQNRPEIQGGEVNVEVPNGNYHLSGFIDTRRPNTIRRALLRRTNIVDFLGDPPGTWLCTEAKYQLATIRSPNPLSVESGARIPRYTFEFEFQYKEGGWNPSVTFVDTRINRPPPDLQPGVGYFTVPYYRRVDFEFWLCKVAENYIL